MPDVITLITKDHREMEKLFARLEDRRSDRSALLHQVSAMLTAHSRAEEDGVYPAIAREAGEEGEIEHSQEEHHEAESLLQVLERTDPDSADFDSRLHEFIDAVKHHIEEEETEILPALKESVSRRRLNELGEVFDERRRRELSAFGMDVDGPRSASGSRGAATRAGSAGKVRGSGRGSGGSSGAGSSRSSAGSGRSGSAGSGGSKSASKEDLYRMAQARDVRGRSTMSKDELAKAVGQGSSSASGGRAKAGSGSRSAESSKSSGSSGASRSGGSHTSSKSGRSSGSAKSGSRSRSR